MSLRKASLAFSVGGLLLGGAGSNLLSRRVSQDLSTWEIFGRQLGSFGIVIRPRAKCVS